MEPANTIISALGGPTAISTEINLHRVTVSKWKRPREKGGTGGIVPMEHIPALLAMSEKIGAGLTFADFDPSKREDAA